MKHEWKRVRHYYSSFQEGVPGSREGNFVCGRCGADEDLPLTTEAFLDHPVAQSTCDVGVGNLKPHDLLRRVTTEGAAV